MHSSKDEAINIKNQQVVFLAPKRKTSKKDCDVMKTNKSWKQTIEKTQSATANIISTKESTSSSAAAKKKACAGMCWNENKETFN